MGLKLVTENTDPELERNRTREDLKWPLRELAANMLRMVRGAGKPSLMTKQLVECPDAMTAYKEAHGSLPPAKLIQHMLDPDAAFLEYRPWMANRDAEDVARWEEDGSTDKAAARRECSLDAGGIAMHHSTVISRRRERDRKRQQRRRARLHDEKIPQTHAVERAIVEALSFAIQKSREDGNRHPEVLAFIWMFGKTVEAILAARLGYDRDGNLAALKAALRRRPGHLSPDFIPTPKPRDSIQRE